MTEPDAQALATVLRLLAKYIVEAQREAQTSFVDQTGSPLGSRRHIATVRRLWAAGDARAAILGRRFLLSPDALKEAFVQQTTQRGPGRRKGSAKQAGAPDLVAQMREKHGFQRVKGAA